MEKRVLVIDDAPLVGRMISYIINQNCPDISYVGQALSATAGIEMVSETKATVVFLDIKMPGMDGITAINYLRNANPDLQIVMLTAFDDFAFIREALRAGAKDYLLKPARPEEILNALERCSSARAPEVGGESGAERNELAEALRAAISGGHGDEAVAAACAYLRQYEPVNAKNYVPVCIDCMEFCHGILNMSNKQGHTVEGLNFLYREFVQSVSASRTYASLVQGMEDFARSSANLFQHEAGDIGFRQVSEAKQYIAEHFNEDISLSDVAQRFFLSTAYFSRLFKEKTGETFTDYRTRCRIERAKQLMTTTDMSISEIASAIGYLEANSFSRQFKTFTGISPSSYRAGKH